MKLYAACPICGYKLCKGENGSDVDILCPRCERLIRVVVTENGIKTEVINFSKKQKDSL